MAANICLREVRRDIERLSVSSCLFIGHPGTQFNRFATINPSPDTILPRFWNLDTTNADNNIRTRSLHLVLEELAFIDKRVRAIGKIDLGISFRWQSDQSSREEPSQHHGCSRLENGAIKHVHITLHAVNRHGSELTEQGVFFLDHITYRGEGLAATAFAERDLASLPP